MSRGRLIFAVVMLALWFGAIVLRLFDLQVRRHESFSRRAEHQQQQAVVLDPPRGTIFDARGRELAVSVEVRSVAADPRAVDDPRATAARSPSRASHPMTTGLPSLSSMKFISGSRTMTGSPSRTSKVVLMLDPTTCSGGMP